MTPGERAVVRGRHLKLLVTSLEAWAGGARALALLPPDTLRAIAAASGLDWLPVAVNLRLTQAIYDGLGAAEADRFFRAHTVASLDGPVLRTLVVTAVRILGLDPASFARWVPRAWHMLFRETGEWSVAGDGPASAVLTLARLPLECAEHQVWLRSVSRSLEAVLDLAKVEGAVELAPRGQGASQAVFRLCWTPRREPSAPIPPP